MELFTDRRIDATVLSTGEAFRLRHFLKMADGCEGLWTGSSIDSQYTTWKRVFFEIGHTFETLTQEVLNQEHIISSVRATLSHGGVYIVEIAWCAPAIVKLSQAYSCHCSHLLFDDVLLFLF
jgi:hypothetical protein